MRLKLGSWWTTAVLLLSATGNAESSNASSTLASHQILPSEFRPAQNFKNVNLLRHTNLERGYVRETVNVVVENIASSPQTEYFVPFPASVIANVGGLEVKDKNEPEKTDFVAELVEYDPYSPTQFYRITFPSALPSKEQLTLSINYNIGAQLRPVPAEIRQQDKQFLLYTFSKYAYSAYATGKQKTKLKAPSHNVPDYTAEPDRQGTMFTYGPYDDVPAGAEEEASIRYEFTKPIIHVTRLERDIEVSQWGGNIALEERYWMTNQGARLSEHFSRVQWAMTAHFPADTSALKELRIPLQGGSSDAYFTDDIGNVSTSRFRTNNQMANLEIKPRYPIFGGWNYSFRIGWNNNLKTYLRQTLSSQYVLKVPFLEGPKMTEGISYGQMVLTFVLPEGATNVKYDCPIPIVSSTTGLRKTFMDTLGRTTLSLTAINVVDEVRDRQIIVTYDYPFSAAFRKPLTIFAGTLSVFGAAWALGSLDVSIGKRK